MAKRKQLPLLPPATGDVLVRKVPKETLELLGEAARLEGTTREEKIRRVLGEWVEENAEPA